MTVWGAHTLQLSVLIADQRVKCAQQAHIRMLIEQSVYQLVNLAVLDRGLVEVPTLALFVRKASTRQRTRLRVLIRVECAQQAKHQIR